MGYAGKITNRCVSRVVWLIFVVWILPSAASALEIAGLSLGFAKAEALDRPLRLADPAFLAQVGGVAFARVAEPDQGVTLIDLAYDATVPDGQRFRALLDVVGQQRTVSAAPVYDWEMVPLVNFVKRDGESCVTLFGHLKDKNREAIVRAQDGMIANYHPAFEGTLLGLRLMEGDMLAFRPEAYDLPKNDEGKYILGAGEQAPDTRANLLRHRKFVFRYSNMREQFQSYVICDHDQSITFAPGARGWLEVTGNPYWYCWTAVGFGIDRQPKYQERLSKLVTAAMREADGVNPAVYRSLQVTMRYSAILRCLKKSQPGAFAALADTASKIRADMLTGTPTILPAPRNN